MSRPFSVNVIPTLLLLLIALSPGGCTNGERRGAESGSSDAAHEDGISGRIALAFLRTTDSAGLASTQVVDGMLAQAFDSIESISYVTVAETGILGGEETSVDELGKTHNLDHIISLSVARFGSVVGVSMTISRLAKRGADYRDQTFAFIRFRNSDDVPLFGPALYEAILRHVFRALNVRSGPMPDGRVVIAGAEPLVIGSVEVSADSSLGRISENRDKIAQDGVRALSDFSAVTFNEFVVFDQESRSRLYNIVGLDQVNDLQPVGDLEREAMYNVNIPYFLSARLTAASQDSLRIRVDIHEVTSGSHDEIRFSSESVYETRLFQTSTVVRDVIAEILVVAKGALQRGADHVQGYREESR